MTKRADDSEDDAAAFAEAVRGARRLDGPRRVLLGLANRAPLRPAPVASPVTGRLAIEEAGETWTARAEGVDRRVLRKLRDGQIPIEGRIDLHGLTRVKAAAALDRFVSASRAAGRRCLLVIHGKGLHSGRDGPALRDAVRDLLITGSQAAAVLACTSAAAAQGGAGATLVYLRR